MSRWHPNWEKIMDGKPKGVEMVTLRPVLHRGEKFISGQEIRRRAQELAGDFTEADAEALFAKARKLPEEWGELIILFPGTEYRNAEMGDAIVSLFRTVVADPHSAGVGAKKLRPRWHMQLFLLDVQGRVSAFFERLCFLGGA